MSRSKKKPYYKDNGMSTHEYWRPIRREWKQKLNQNYYKDDFQLRVPKSIIDDYDYCDFILLPHNEEEAKKGSRK
jgi:hypothetical protein